MYVASGSSFVPLSQLAFLVCSHLLHTVLGEQELLLILFYTAQESSFLLH